MAKIAIISDIHVGIKNDNPIMYDYFGKSLKWFFDHIDKNHFKYVIDMGDLYDRRKYINYKSAMFARTEYLEQLNNRNIETHIIAGNHDIFSKTTNSINALDELVTGRYSNIRTYTSPHTIRIDGLDILLVPWIDDTKPQWVYDDIKASPAEIVMGHLAIDGFQMDSGNISVGGDDRKIYERFDMVFSGHYHHRSRQGNIHYLGAFAEHNWSDWNDPRGFSVFDTETRELEFYQNPYSIYKMISYDDIKNPEILETIKNTDYSEYRDCFVKILAQNRTNPYAFDLLIDKLYKVNPVDITIIEDVQTFKDEAIEEVNQTEPTPKILDKYIQGLTLPVESDKMKDYMKGLYNEAIAKEHVE